MVSKNFIQALLRFEISVGCPLLTNWNAFITVDMVDFQDRSTQANISSSFIRRFRPFFEIHILRRTVYRDKIAWLGSESNVQRQKYITGEGRPRSDMYQKIADIEPLFYQ